MPVLGPVGHVGAGEGLHLGLGLKWRKTEPWSPTHFCSLDLCSALLTLTGMYYCVSHGVDLTYMDSARETPLPPCSWEGHRGRGCRGAME